MRWSLAHSMGMSSVASQPRSAAMSRAIRLARAAISSLGAGRCVVACLRGSSWTLRAHAGFRAATADKHKNGERSDLASVGR